MSEKNTLYLRYARVSRGIFTITSVASQVPCETDSIGWKGVPLSGILEWWFAGGHPALYHNGKGIEMPDEVPSQ